jgi:hypothetical protein
MVKEHIDQSKRRFCITGAQSVAVATISPLLLSSCSSSEYDAYALSTAHGKIQVYEHKDIIPLLNIVRGDLNPVYRAFTALYGEENQGRIKKECELRYTRDVDWCVRRRTADKGHNIVNDIDMILKSKNLLDKIEVGLYAPDSFGDNRVTLAGVRYPEGVFVARYKPRE